MAKPSAEEVWEGLKSESDLGNVKRYSMGETFGEKCVIEHPKFGLGIVTESTHSKIEVIFRDGPKSLVHSRD